MIDRPTAPIITQNCMKNKTQREQREETQREKREKSKREFSKIE